MRRAVTWVLALAAVAAAAAVVALPPRTEQLLPAPAAGPASPGTTRAPSAGPAGPVTTSVGFGYGPAVVSPTRLAPQRKLWVTDGRWWALMVNPKARSVHVFELVGDAWRDTGVVVDDRQSSTGDVLWDGERAWVVSRTADGPVRVTALEQSRDGVWSIAAGFPVDVAQGGARTASLALDAAGVPWIAYLQGDTVHVAGASDPSGERWSEARPAPVPEAQATDDDVVGLVLAGEQLLLVWSNQRTDAFYALPRTADGWGSLETAFAGPEAADGHLSLAARADGVVYAAVKTSNDDEVGRDTAPLLVVLERSTAGEWTPSVAAVVADNVTRPVLSLDEARGQLRLMYATPKSGGRIEQKISPLDPLRYAPGRGTVLMSDPAATLNDVTTTQQRLDGIDRLVVLASDVEGRRYFHAEVPLGGAAEDAG